MEHTNRALVVEAGLRLVRHRRLEGGLGAEPTRRGRASPARARSSPATCATATCARTDGCSACSDSKASPSSTPPTRCWSRRSTGRRRSRAWSASSRPTGSPRRGRRRRCSAPGAGTRPSTSAPRFRVKRIVVTPGKQLSLQKHHHRAEHWVVVQRHRRGYPRRRSAAGARERIGLPAARLHCTGCRTPAESPSRSSRCRPAPISKRTTSCGSRTISGAYEPSARHEVRNQWPTRARHRDDRSGLRGLGRGPSCAISARPERFDAVLVGRDRRPSSPRIAAACRARQSRPRALTPLDCGVLPTPALALEAAAARRAGRDGDRQPHPVRPQRAEVLPARRRNHQGRRGRDRRRRSRRRPDCRAARGRDRWRRPSLRRALRRIFRRRVPGAVFASASSSTARPGATSGRRRCAAGRRGRAARADRDFVPIDTEAIAPEDARQIARLGAEPAGRAGLDRRRRRPSADRRRGRARAAAVTRRAGFRARDEHSSSASEILKSCLAKARQSSDMTSSTMRAVALPKICAPTWGGGSENLDPVSLETGACPKKLFIWRLPPMSKPRNDSMTEAVRAMETAATAVHPPASVPVRRPSGVLRCDRRRSRQERVVDAWLELRR